MSFAAGRPGNREGRPGNREGRPGNREGRPGNREGRPGLGGKMKMLDRTVYSFVLTFMIRMTVAVSRKKRNDDNKKLKRVLSTKLSIEDYKVFRVLTNIVYHYKPINEDRPSEMLRFIVTAALDGLRKYPGFFTILQSSRQDQVP
jgi:hypothetical protein